jgi:peroxiredoxin Q/BCP
LILEDGCIENIVVWVKNNIWFILFFTWGIPLGIYRSRFRKIVYQTDSWLINIKPYFIRETKALFSTMYPENEEYIRFRNFYRFYLGVYSVLFGLWYFFR